VAISAALLYSFFSQNILYHLFNQSSPFRRTTPSTQRRPHALLHVLPNHVHLYVHFRPYRFSAQRDLLLSMLNEHDAKRPLLVVHFRQSKRCPINGDVTLGDQIR
jgi:hypothetical protein